MTEVRSSNLRAVGYDEDGTLVIRFRSGGTYAYHGVPPAVYDGLMRAGSHGRYFHSRIKGRYAYRRIPR